MTVNQLAAYLHLEKSTASRLAKSLLERDLVRKRAPESDGRVVILQVTEAGLRLSRRILNDLTEEYMELLEEFEPGVRAAIPQVLDRVTQIISARVAPSGPTCC
jgi:DNA-binding MarR family transcriptional regulator